MICISCSNSNDPDATFCAFCGGSLTAMPVAATAIPGVGVRFEPAVPTIAIPASLRAPAPATADGEGLNYQKFIELLGAGQGLLAQLAFRFYYATGLKSYLVTHHDSFVVPNLKRDAGDIYRRIHQDMENLGYQELLVTLIHMRTEHIQTLPYLSRSMIGDQAKVDRNYNFFGALVGAIRLYLEIAFGFIFLIFDLGKLIMKSLSHGAGLSVRTVGREGMDELVTGKRLMLASTYRNTRTYTYVRDVGPETYVGWFTHHEPLPGTIMLMGIIAVFLFFGFLTGMSIQLPFVFFFGVALGLAYTYLFAPWLLNRLGALPQPRYLSALVFALIFPVIFLGYGVMEYLTSPQSMFGGRSVRGLGGTDPFSIMLMVGAFTAYYALVVTAIAVFVKTIMMGVTHFDQFDAETHAKIVKERIALILAEYLESSGYSPDEIGSILEQRMPAAGRYRRARA